MDRRNLEALKRCQPAFIQSLNVVEVLDYLIAGRHVSDDEQQRIRAQITFGDKARLFLDILSKKSNDAFDCFHEALIKLQPFLAETLKKQLENIPFSK